VARKASRSPGSDRGGPAIDWEAARQFYASLPAESRSYGAVAEHFGVSRRTVESHGRRGRWRERLARIDEDAARQADQQLGRARAEQLADFHRLIEASCVAYARQLASGQVRITASDLVGLIKVSLQLHGEPSSRVELVTGSVEWVALRTRILEALAAFPEAQLALTEALAEDSNEPTRSRSRPRARPSPAPARSRARTRLLAGGAAPRPAAAGDPALLPPGRQDDDRLRVGAP
jgi:hypothetical protein